MQALKRSLEILKSSPALFILLLGFGLFPIYTSLADLPFWNDVSMRIMLLGMAALGLNLVLGFGGMVSFGHAAFIGIGAYSVGISQFYGIDNGWLHILFALLFCAAIGLVIGFLALRTKGIYFIMITLAFAQMLYFFFVSLEVFGGDDGMGVDRASFLIIDLWDPLRLYYLIWIALFAVSLLLLLIINSRFGVILQGIKDNESRIEAMGLSALHFKITAYVASAAICGLAGALFANWQEYVSPDIMHWSRSGELMIVIVLGGLSYIAGPLIGAIVFFLLEEFLPELLFFIAPDYSENWMIIFGPMLIAVVLFTKGGLMAIFHQIYLRLTRRQGTT